MKKNMLASMALGALLLVGCNSMEDKNKKDEKYYLEHIEEAQSKLKWCLDETNTDEKELEKIVNDVLETKVVFLTESFRNLGNRMFFVSGLDDVNGYNCRASLIAYLENELEKAKK